MTEEETKVEAKKKPTPVNGYEGTGHEKDPLKTKPSTGQEGTGSEKDV